jgi:hypothetical protein
MSELIADNAAALFEFVDRAETAMPADYLPEATGVMLAGDDVLTAAGHRPGSHLKGWARIGPGNYKKYVGLHTLMVRQCGGARSEHWTVERIDEDHNTEALVLPFGPALIFAHNRQAAMRIAEYCYPNPKPPFAACWEVGRRRN